jgi:hypothetical protein
VGCKAESDTVRKAAIIAGIYAGLSVSGARAVDIDVKSTLYQSLEINSNYQLQANPPGETYIPVSTLIFDALARTPTMRFAATVDLSYRTYLGPGAENLLPAFDRGFRGSAEAYRDTSTYKIEGSVRTIQALQLQLAETGVRTVGGDITTSWVEGGIRNQLSYWDLATLSVRATTLQFTDPTQAPSLDITSTGTWIHRATQLTEIIPMVQLETVTYGSPEVSPISTHTQFAIWRGTLGVNSRVTKLLTFQGAVGVADVILNQSGGVLPVNPLQFTSGSRADWIANMQATYRLTSRDTFSLTAAQTIGPDSLGVLRKFDVIGLVLSHRFVHPATLSFFADYSHQPLAIGGFTDLYSAATTYDYNFARDWYLALTYRFRQRVGVPSNANSHAVFMSLRRDVTIIPSAIQAAPPVTPAAITSLLSWPAAWIRPWRDAAWWQR